MERDPIRQLRRRARRLVVAPPDSEGVRYVYAITHQGIPELAGAPALDVGRATVELEQLRDLAWRLGASQTEEQRAAVQAEVAETKARAEALLREEIIGTPEKKVSYIERCRAVVMGAVEAVGLALPDAPTGPCQRDVEPHEVCEILDTLRPGTAQEERVYMKPLTILPGKSSRPGEVGIRDFGDAEVSKLHNLFAEAFTVQRSVTPLSGESPRSPVG